MHARSPLVRVPLLQPHHVLQRSAARAVVEDTVVVVLPADRRHGVEQGESGAEVRGRPVGQRRGGLGNGSEGLGR